MSGNVNSVFYAKTYHPIQAGSIDGTDILPHDNAVYRALLCSQAGLYDPFGDPKLIGDPYCTIFVGRLSHLTTEQTLRKAMSKYGKVKNLRLVRHIGIIPFFFFVIVYVLVPIIAILAIRISYTPVDYNCLNFICKSYLLCGFLFRILSTVYAFFPPRLATLARSKSYWGVIYSFWKCFLFNQYFKLFNLNFILNSYPSNTSFLQVNIWYLPDSGILM
ncbi:uncharacterized protein LOC114315102 [Camellia sinensis]|uniref:uncharacterized protein LOC114315102 n=1 Tax=Camellia sinensis TaxID=4442 RepID=UPI001036957B|nr:uncharacterized protein LOC114315102 [Camellia sinensis]